MFFSNRNHIPFHLVILTHVLLLLSWRPITVSLKAGSPQLPKSYVIHKSPRRQTFEENGAVGKIWTKLAALILWVWIIEWVILRRDERARDFQVTFVVEGECSNLSWIELRSFCGGGVAMWSDNTDEHSYFILSLMLHRIYLPIRRPLTVILSIHHYYFPDLHHRPSSFRSGRRSRAPSQNSR